MRKITPQELIQALTLVGWTKDKYGHVQKDLRGVIHRLRMGPKIFLERLDYVTPTTINPSRTQWKPIETFSYDQVSITQDSQIRMGSRLF